MGCTYISTKVFPSKHTVFQVVQENCKQRSGLEQPEKVIEEKKIYTNAKLSRNQAFTSAQ